LVEVNQNDFDRALAELVPSVSEKELEHYKMVKMRFTQQEANKFERNSEQNLPVKEEYSNINIIGGGSGTTGNNNEKFQEDKKGKAKVG
jgi:hypothetical protein